MSQFAGCNRRKGPAKTSKDPRPTSRSKSSRLVSIFQRMRSFYISTARQIVSTCIKKPLIFVKEACVIVVWAALHTPQGFIICILSVRYLGQRCTYQSPAMYEVVEDPDPDTDYTMMGGVPVRLRARPRIQVVRPALPSECRSKSTEWWVATYALHSRVEERAVLAQTDAAGWRLCVSEDRLIELMNRDYDELPRIGKRKEPVEVRLDGFPDLERWSLWVDVAL